MSTTFFFTLTFFVFTSLKSNDKLQKKISEFIINLLNSKLNNKYLIDFSLNKEKKNALINY